MKENIKIESVSEFLARGGKITKVAINVGKRTYTAKEPKSIADVDMSALPEALRLKYGIKA